MPASRTPAVQPAVRRPSPSLKVPAPCCSNPGVAASERPEALPRAVRRLSHLTADRLGHGELLLIDAINAMVEAEKLTQTHRARVIGQVLSSASVVNALYIAAHVPCHGAARSCTLPRSTRDALPLVRPVVGAARPSHQRAWFGRALYLWKSVLRTRRAARERWCSLFSEFEALIANAVFCG